MKPQRIPTRIIARVGEIIGNALSHSDIDTLFLESGFPDPTPDGNKITKCQTWLRRANASESQPLQALSELLNNFACRYPEDNEWSIRGWDRIRDALVKEGLRLSTEYELILIDSHNQAFGRENGPSESTVAPVPDPEGEALDKAHDHLSDAPPSASRPSPRIFISHSSEDVEVATALTGLIMDAFKLQSSAIRCTSVDGHRLPAGTATGQALRQEVRDCELLLGLLSFSSLASMYSLFELGGRWAVDRPLMPLFGPGASADNLPAPLGDSNALDLAEPTQVRQLLDDIGTQLSLEIESPTFLHSKVESLSKLVQAKSNNLASQDSTQLLSRPSGLSNDAMELLGTAIDDRNGRILRVEHSMGLRIISNDRDFVDDQGPRAQARWDSALRELEGGHFIEDAGVDRSVFKVTHAGYQVGG